MTSTSSSNRRTARPLRSALALCALAAAPWAASAQVQPDWVRPLGGSWGAMVAVDVNNNAYVAGTDVSSAMTLSKVGPGGNLLWQSRFDHPGLYERAGWVALDRVGNPIIVGALVDTSQNPNGLVVQKLSPAGTVLWQDVIPGYGGTAVRVASDSANNTFVLGRVWTTNASGNTTYDMVTVKYSASGTREWVRPFGVSSTSIESPGAMVVNAQGQIIVTGGTGGQMLIVAYDSAGNTLFSKGVPANTAGLDIALGPNGEFYVVGGTWSTTAGQTFLVVKHDSAFNEQWRKTYAVGHYAQRAVVDSTGNLIATGIAGNYFNWSTVKISPDGDIVWQRSYDQHGYNDEIPFSMVLGPDNAVTITGQGGPAPYDRLGNLSYLSTVTLRYAADGTQTWSASTEQTVRGLGAALGQDGSVFVVGESPQLLLHYAPPAAGNAQPVALARATSATSGASGLAVSFSAEGSYDPDGELASLTWSFGDGSMARGASVTHTFYGNAAYPVVLTATDKAGAATLASPITVNVGQSSGGGTATGPTPTSLSLSSSRVTGGMPVTATVKVSGSAGTTVALSSSNPAVASVPASVVIPAGATSASFTVTTADINTSTSVTLRAKANGVSTSASLSVRR
ncbi:PDK repeat-containing protein [Burkholderiales bacterium JOSHI_001]|nr:PDK repeat-containing protein [Burkholderiales bacterium JOSHI_001]